ncbi:M48 family metallopeptidase [Kitasatospora sp. DSM 101779]|uniref:M48 family metallopeptidase n=1 Tax=Kitasatospora sp. DSM 101779 TaxID=2853165 RepID=UPI0021DB3690|nr:M48 family metallopeptidase [Kitasatospora sp. DSM 101779]MCU7826598.1 M48 family metallopeptidase [Kitasatospora sp. DSM 101779]
MADDPRFTSWCPSCEWNLDPAPAPTPAASAREQRRTDRRRRKEEAARRTVRARVERVYAAVTADRSAVRDPAWLGANALAGAVHLTTLTLAVCAVGLLIAAPTWPLRVLGLFAAALVHSLRPRLGRLPRNTARLYRGDAPGLFALTDRVAQALGGRPVDVVLVTAEFNAGFGRIGLRRRHVLRLGLPLWAVLAPEQRLALLGHELGHQVNADSRRGLWLRSALAALDEWEELTRPALYRQSFGTFVELAASAILQLLLRPLNLGARALLNLLDRLTLRTGQAAEYRADRLAADLAGTDASLGLLRTLMLRGTVDTTLLRMRADRARRARRTGTAPAPATGPWEELSAQLADVPALERERLLRLSAREFGTVDRSHPPTHLRLAMLEGLPPTAARLDTDAADWTAIDAELAPAARQVAADLELGR